MSEHSGDSPDSGNSGNSGNSGDATPPRIEAFIHAAADYVRRSLGGVELPADLPAALAYVDHYLTKTRSAGPVTDEILLLVATAIGAWFGERARQELGGHWELDGEPANWRVALDAVELRFAPVGMAAEALRGAEVDGFPASLATRKAFTPQLEAAFEAVGPVDEAYYYSLTGRYETILHALEVVAELTKRATEKN